MVKNILLQNNFTLKFIDTKVKKRIYQRTQEISDIDAYKLNKAFLEKNLTITTYLNDCNFIILPFVRNHSIHEE